MSQTPTPYTIKVREIFERLYRISADVEATNETGRYKFTGVDQALHQLERLVLDDVIKEDEVFIDIPVVNNLGEVTQIIDGSSYTPYMVARNNLRATQRAIITNSKE